MKTVEDLQIQRRHRPTVAVVDLDAIRHNVRSLKPAASELMAVVKANGYGHGAIPVARAALEAGATWLGVALVEEGVRLRLAGVDAPILVLTQFPPGSEHQAVSASLTPTLYTEDGLARLARAAGGAGLSIGVHVKVDTGMHRVGLPPEHAAAFVRRVVAAGFELEGLWTHLAKSEEVDDPFTARQLALFERTVERIRRSGIVPRYLHAANSGGLLCHPASHLDVVRVGIAMYGVPPGPGMPREADLHPAMTWRSAVSLVKRVAAGEAISYGQRYRLERAATIATVPVGYADGYSRLLGARARVLIGGRRYPIAGTVTMDQLMVDCGDDPVREGDEVILVGQQGQDRITADEVAGWMGTVGYEILCGVSERVPREYLGEA